MSKLKIHAGDWGEGSGQFASDCFTLPESGKMWGKETVSGKELESVEVATEESIKRIGGTLGWGVAGLAVLGPIGMLAGLLAGGRGKDVTFVAKFKDGRK